MANFRYRREVPKATGHPVSIRLESTYSMFKYSEHIDFEGRIRDKLMPQQNIWIILEDEFEGYN